MRGARCVVLCVGLLAAASCRAATVCEVSAVSLAFGTYNEFQIGPTDSTGNIAVTCHGTAGDVVAYTLSVSAGSGTLAARRMQSPQGAVLNYNLYASPARVLVWGDGSAGSVTLSDSFQLRAGALTRSYPVYGRIFALQKSPVGVYSDSIIVTVSY